MYQNKIQIKNSDFQFRVNINKKIESLNISNTVAIVCHHINYTLKNKYEN